jgi:hypothetical protein
VDDSPKTSENFACGGLRLKTIELEFGEQQFRRLFKFRPKFSEAAAVSEFFMRETRPDSLCRLTRTKLELVYGMLKQIWEIGQIFSKKIGRRFLYVIWGNHVR